MSYILDALQRADAERERGHVPGLRSQIVPPPGRGKPAAPNRWRPWHAAVMAAGVLVAAAVWWWSVPSSPPGSTVELAPTAPQIPAPEAAPAPVAESRPVAVPEPVMPILAPPRPEPPRAASTAAPPAPAPAPAEPTPGAAAPTAKAPAEAPPPVSNTTSAAVTGPVTSFAELSPEARARLPAVNVSGSTYSLNPALRMLIVNGKVLQEGQEIAPGLKLETIGQRSAVLNHQGLRYSIGY